MIDTFKAKRTLLTSMSWKLMSGFAIALLVTAPALPARSQISSPSEPPQPPNPPVFERRLVTNSQLKRLETALQIIDKRIESLEPAGGTPWTSIYRLAGLARAYNEVGDREQAVELLARAVLIAKQYSVDNGYDYPKALVQIAPYYDDIGEPEIADDLLKQAIEVALTSDSTGTMLGFVAEAYAKIEDSQIKEEGLLNIVELVANSKGPARNSIGGYSLARFFTAYAQIEDSAAASEGLTQLLELKLVLADKAATTEDRRSVLSLGTLTQFAIAFGQHNNPEAAKELLDWAMEILRSSEESEGKSRYSIGMVASAYGYLGNIDDATPGLKELMTMAQLTAPPLEDNLTEEQKLQAIHSKLYDDLAPLSAIAVAYGRLGDTEKAREILGSYIERLRQIENSGSVLLFGSIVQSYKEIDDLAGQESTLQQLFDEVPALKEISSQGLNIADVTPGYLGITTLLESYIATPNDAIAQARLKVLEDFFKDIRYGEYAFSGQLSDLASAAVIRGDEENAHRLMLDAMQLVGTPEDQLIPDDPRFNVIRRSGENFDKVQQRYVLSNMATNYGQIENEKIKSAGLEALKQAASKVEDPEFRADVEDAIALAYVGI